MRIQGLATMSLFCLAGVFARRSKEDQERANLDD